MRPLTPRELADRWQCSSQHIYNLVKDGSLRAIRIGKLIRIPADAVEAFECGSSNTAVSGAPNSEMQPAIGTGQASVTSTPHQKIVRLPSGRQMILPVNSQSRRETR